MSAKHIHNFTIHHYLEEKKRGEKQHVGGVGIIPACTSRELVVLWKLIRWKESCV